MARLVSLIALGVLSVAAGCAVSGPADISPDLDPNLDRVDAGHTPQAVPGGNPPSAPPSTPPPEGDGGTDSGKTVTPPPPPPPPPPGAPKPAQGEVLITEVMYDLMSGTEPAGEWIEVHNTTSATRTLSGLTLVDGASRTHTIGAGITIAAGAYVVLARNKTSATALKVPAAAIAYEYGTGLADTAGILLANGATGAIMLKDGGTIIANAPYGGWYSQSGGSSVQLKNLTYAAGSSETNWCLSASAWSTGSDKGTPGAASDCP